MKIAVIGAGAIGSVIAGRLWKQGEDVVLVGRGDQAAAIRERGLILRGDGKVERYDPPIVEALAHPCGLAIFATKTQDIESAYAASADSVEQSLILTIQNGVQADNILSHHFYPEQVISSVVMFGATYTSPGQVALNFSGDWILGKRFVSNDQSLHDAAALLRKSFSVSVSENILGMKWMKLFLNLNNGIPALIGRTVQEAFADMDFCRLGVMLLKEAVLIVKDANIELASLPGFSVDDLMGLAARPVEEGAAVINKTMTRLSKEPFPGSVLQSLLRGKATEIDFINGEIVAVASGMRMSAPLNRKLMRMVHSVEERGRFYSPEEVKEAFELNGPVSS